MVLVKLGLSPTKLLVAASLCGASVLSVPAPAFAACQAGQSGCVLPTGTAAPLSVAQPETTPAPIYDDGGDGKSWLPIILGVLALGALAYFLIFDDDDPESP